ncbi:hypothetical protein FEM41_20000 [Jejubacter calystegiae]|uniref:Uncharacterized protein n=1 Tax=Jejubacter calystegiae TaxID=2579935 RepID=A0A4P8YNH4_9ENTR|nr:hypothetical protein FEM41_20000 [Jejubacter calystegiae]
MVITFKKETSAHQNGHTRAHHAAMAFSEVAFVNGLGVGMRGECAVKFRYKKAPANRGLLFEALSPDVVLQPANLSRCRL